MEGPENNKIYIPELLRLLLRRWRALLVAALVGALILGGIRLTVAGLVLTDTQKLTKAVEHNTQTMEKYWAEKTSLEQQIAALRSGIARRQTYLENSVLMQLDPFDHSAGSLRVQIRTDYQIQPGMVYQDPDPTDSVVEAYAVAVQSAELLSELAAKAELSVVYMTELITVTMDLDTNSLSVQLQHTDAQLLEALLQMVTAHLEKLSTGMEESHTAQVLNMGIRRRMDMGLQTRQIAAREEMDALLKSLSAARTRLDELKQPSEKPATWAQAFAQSGLFALLGAAAGLLVFALGYCLYAAGCEWILSERMLREAGLTVVDSIPAHEADEQRRRLLYDLQNRCPKGLLVAGHLPHRLESALAEAMPEAVHTQDLLQGAQALQALTACTGVVLTVSYGSRRQDLCRQLALIRDYGKQLIGCVFVDSQA